MSTYLCYARTGKEFEVADAMAERGAVPYCAKRMRFIRKGKQRRPEPDIQPYLQNYIFAEIPVDIYLNVMDVKFLASTTHLLSNADVEALGKFRAEVDRVYQEQERKRRNQEAVSEYEPGQALQFLDGRFSDSVVRFRDIVERAHDLHPKVRASVDMMGREVMIEVDPLSVRGAR